MRPTSLVLEPLGEIYPLEPGESQVVVYEDDPDPHLSIYLLEDEIKLWEEGPGMLRIERDEMN